MSDFAVSFFAALADPTRLRAVVLLAARGEQCVCKLVAALGVAQPKMSRHLAVLREAGIVADRREGQWVHYRIRDDLPGWAAASIAHTAAALAETAPYRNDLAA